MSDFWDLFSIQDSDTQSAIYSQCFGGVAVEPRRRPTKRKPTVEELEKKVLELTKSKGKEV